MGLPKPYYLYYDKVVKNLVLLCGEVPDIALKRFILTSTWFVCPDGKTLKLEMSTGFLEGYLDKEIRDFLNADAPTFDMRIELSTYLFRMHPELLPTSSSSSE